MTSADGAGGGDPETSGGGATPANGRDDVPSVPPPTAATAPPPVGRAGPSMPPPLPPPLRVSLSDVRNAFPKESDGEASVMDHIEETDPTGGIGDGGGVAGRGTAGDGEGGDGPRRIYPAPSCGSVSSSSALADGVTGIPSTLRTTLQQQQSRSRRRSAAARAERSRRSSFRRNGSESVGRDGGGDGGGGGGDAIVDATRAQQQQQRAKTIEDELFELTNVILPSQPDGRGDHEEAGVGGGGGADGTPDRPLTQAENFAANAQRMFGNVGRTVQRERNRFSESGDGDVEEGRKSFGPSLHQREQFENAKEVYRIIRSKRKSTNQYIRTTMLWLIFPATGVAALLFYVFGNPRAKYGPTDVFFGLYDGTNDQPTGNGTAAPWPTPEPELDDTTTSYSWFILFFGVRQVITFGLALGLQVLTVAYYQQASISFALTGPMTRLCIIQSRGWPLVVIMWGILDFMMLYGENSFANHWLFFQNFLGVFNADNSSGGFPYSSTYFSILMFMIGTGGFVAAKRFFIGVRFGQNSYYRYAHRLSKVLKQIVQVARVSRMSKMKDDVVFCAEDIAHESLEVDLWLERHAYHTREGRMERKNHTPSHSRDNTSKDDESGIEEYTDFEAEPLLSDDREETDSFVAPNGSNLLASLNIGNVTDGSFSSAQKLKIDEMLGEWEDADLADTRVEEPSLSAVVQFGSSLAVLESDYPFSQSFGFAQTRYDVIDCSQKVYSKLLRVQERLNVLSIIKEQREKDLGVDSIRADDIMETATTLRFHTIALIAIDEHGNLDNEKAKNLMAVFRPTREGDISLLDFCKSIDMIYKEIRKLRASVANESRMNAATEKLINVLFYFALVCVGMTILGIDPAVVLGALATFVISFSFCVSGASSDYIRGLLFILVQKPYDIGDRVAIAGAQDIALGTGSPFWTVKDVGLYHTTILFDASQEYGTLSNGVLSTLRIINAARSPRAQLQFFMRFGVAVKLEVVEEFKRQLFDYVRSKPREWLRPVAFRMNRIAAELGFMEYFVLLQHRESWQVSGALKDSLSDVQQFSFKLSADLAMDYQSPALPITVGGPPGSNNFLGLLRDTQKDTERPAT